MMRFAALRAPSPVRSAMLAVAGPGIAVGLGLAIDRRSLVSATALCMLAVVVAAAYGGRGGGLAASVIAFLALNFFFTEPYHTLWVFRLPDLVALFVFLAISVVVGELLARALEERSRAQRRYAEAQFLDRISVRLASGEPMERVLAEFARDVVATFDLARCEVRLHERADPIVAVDPDDALTTPGRPIVFEAPIGPNAAFGTVIAVRPASAPAFGTTEKNFLQAIAAQAGLALQRSKLDRDVARARFDAEASRLRAALFSSVTHDLRTPLASIKASASGLLDRSARYTESQSDEMLRTVVEEADRLNRIVANMLDLARMRAGELLPSASEVWMEDLVGAVVTRMRRSLEGFTVRVDMESSMPSVMADPLQMDQVLTNVLENAIRFSPRGSEIAVTGSHDDSVVRVRIADQGPGIPIADREHVFEEFYRRDAGGGRAGTGLGLTIAHAIVKAHGGRIWAEATPRGGAAIAFEIPAAGVAQPVG
jgi:two-component system sensor histidine kinase KdpD